MTEVSSLTGRLLVATPALADPNFDRAVVLLLDHDDEGTLGVVLNRPTPVDVGDILEPWAPLAGEPGVVFQGGPVSLDAALGLAVVPGDGPGGLDGPPGAPGPDGTGGHRVDGSPGGGPDGSRSRTADAGEPDESDEPEGLLGWRRVYGAIGLVDLEAPPELLAAELGSLRIFAGYAGWGPGQLEDELAEGAWFVVDSEPGDVSSPRPETLWRDVLRRQRSELAMIATYPDDPSLN
ncbi:YqgE/AlgH family protein [Streptomyces lichenis]|uniref:UPF0301 protein M1O15_04590 n=1 Tax=Streptomyces lichenis TaxID=2306967 RepID=A0ABT0I5T9_9ACTN|nr:YqgE/AlgH family protein [Streptomyces lichenis]MCK8676684.1 YqgE/AlgH family protein [Streptomyces lichenis]